ncbi:MAG: type II secretion system F family protein [Candidatus Pacebacteria bacterium]|nr:type II secretion system F family protein [Candidatus Paceibacterota bacterium]
MLFKYQAIDASGAKQEGSIDAISRDVAIASLQRRSLTISAIEESDPEKKSLLGGITLFESVTNRDIVLLSRQIATLFEAQVSALRVFRLLASESEKPLLGRVLTEVGDDLQSGSPISKALSKHPKVFSAFYVNMVKAGEESGKLDETFLYLADYLDRSYEVMSKAKNALIYPAFVIATFFVVMILMMTMVIPRISSILIDAGQAIPVYTQVVISISNFFVNYGVFLLILLIVGSVFLFRYANTPQGRASFSSFELAIPYVGDLYKKLYLSRIADNLATMLGSGISVVQAVDVTANVVGNAVYADILQEVATSVKGGGSVSGALEKRKEVPGIMVAMMRVGEETGELGSILKTLAKFYQREVSTSVDTLVGLIEPIMIVTLGLGVGILLASVLVPIYNLSAAI